MFRRRRETDEPAETPQEIGQAQSDDAGQLETAAQTAAVRTSGPWDEADAPDDEIPRLDLGALRVPTPPNVEVRLEVEPSSSEAVAVSLVAGASQLQIGAFAAPRSAGIWVEVRAEIAASLAQGGGNATEASGRFGVEVRGRAPAAPGGPQQLLRFIGVDGPRWFLRGMFSGPAATDPTAARVLEDAFAAVVVARGGEARAPREPLPLVLPPEVRQAMGMDPGEGKPVIEMPVRGPEITETR